MFKISVIIPCYKVEQAWFERIFRTLQLQTIGFENLQIICVVDASPDDTYERLLAFEKQFPDNLLVINCATNIGPGGARNLAMEYAQGEAIAMLDSDDWVEPAAYEHMYEKLIRYDCDLVQCFGVREREDFSVGITAQNEPKKTGQGDEIYWFNDPEDSLEKRRNDREIYLHNRDWVGSGYFNCHWAALYSKRFLQENNIYYLEGCKFEDNFFTGLVGFHVNKVYVLHEVLYHYMVNSNSIIVAKGIEAHMDRLPVFQEMVAEYARRGFLEAHYKFIEVQFLQLFFANTLFNFKVRGGYVPFEVFKYMQGKIVELFPTYQQNPRLHEMEEFDFDSRIMLRFKLIRKQIDPEAPEPPEEIWARISGINLLGLIEADLTEPELDWWLEIYYSVMTLSNTQYEAACEAVEPEFSRLLAESNKSC